ncbi:MAG: 1-acyl-sn-glycerol-3-phosphate acyltransferase, partial [Candidatus Pacearchaeota archaeon]
RIAKDGEILARGDNIFRGYYKNKEETEKTLKEGWIYTGDIGKFDEEGFLYIVGRKKNMILSSSGMNIYPEDIEKVLNKISGIKDSVVLGLDNGKTLVAVILSDKKIDNEKIIKEANSKLSEHQYLSKIIQWPEEDFPRTTTKKVIRRKVEERIILGKPLFEKSSDVLLNIIAKICDIPAKSIKENSKLINLGLDSIKRIELVTEIEDNYNIEFNESLITEKTTVEDLRKLLKTSSDYHTESGINYLNSKIFNPIRFVFQNLVFLALRPFYSISVKGLENLPKENCIIIANHTSMFDTFALFKALPFSYRMNTASAAAKDFFFKNKITGFFGRLSFNAFGFSRKGNTKQSLKDFSNLINKGMNVLIYPEGTRSRTGKLLDFKEGIGVLEWELNVPIVPVKLKGLHEVLPVGSYFPKFGKVEVIIGKPLTFNKMTSPKEITKKLYETIKNL